MSISIKMYNSPAYVDRIMQANDLKENDVIYVGQKIIIPEL
ncbi:lysM domain protein [Coprococcus sp. CAG:782]|nr:lysM domain protein [Coprococcus sp. CAG:782]